MERCLPPALAMKFLPSISTVTSEWRLAVCSSQNESMMEVTDKNVNSEQGNLRKGMV